MEKCQSSGEVIQQQINQMLSRADLTLQVSQAVDGLKVKFDQALEIEHDTLRLKAGVGGAIKPNDQLNGF